MKSNPLTLFGVACIDEAGRGPMIGPMVVCGLLFEDDVDTPLRNLGIKDSKQLSPKRREELYDDILNLTKRSSIRRVSASKIDELRGRGVTLNEIELREFISITKSLRPLRLFVDAVDVKAERFGLAIAERSKLKDIGIVVISEHRADLTYPMVSAASVIAKVERDRAILKLHDQYGDFGSGYPNDPKTLSFVRDLVASKEKLPKIVRRSWAPIRRLESEMNTKQIKLDSY
ncbi:ribonuclease HII [Candidatus Thorarchaeota archaeon]|nr:MAG: ribonuclease HII [Candidatus Thorarchaeota archaeon]